MNKKILKSLSKGIFCAFILLSIPYTLGACSSSPSRSSNPQSNYTQPKQNSQPSKANENNFSKEARDDLDEQYKKIEKAQDAETNSRNSIKNHDSYMEREKEIQRQKEKK